MDREEGPGVTSGRDSRIVTVPLGGRRRHYSAEQKKAILAEASSPGATVTAVAKRHAITRGLIHNWRRQEAASLLGATVRFTSVRLPAEMPKAAAEAEVAPTSCSRIEIDLPGDVRVRLEGTVDEEGLRRVLRALRR